MKASRLVVPFVLSALLFALYKVLLDYPQVLPKDVRDLITADLMKWLLFVAFVPLIFFVIKLIDLLVFEVVMRRRRNVSAPQLLREIVSIALYFTLIAIALTKTIGGAVIGVLATGTVLAAIFGLALQETLGNLFAGIALHLEDSFEIGDIVKSGEYIGVVEGARWRGTRLRTFSNTVVILPNSMLARERIEVYPRNNLNGRVLSIGVDFNVAPATVIQVLTQAMMHIEGISRDLPPLARVAAFGEFSVTYELKYFTRDYARRDQIDADIRKAVWYALKRSGISIPFPIRAYQPYKAPQQENVLSQDELVGVLQEIDILSPLSATAMDALAGAARALFFSKGECILSRGSAGDSMFIVNDGTVSVRIVDDSPAGWHEVAQLGPGSVFGEMALLTGELRTADVVALTDVHAVEIAKSALAPVLQNHPELASAISAKVLERRDTVLSHPDGGEGEETSVSGRIKSWFGL